MTIKHLDRRTLLRGALATGAAVTIPLPLLEIMLNGNGTRLAHAATPLTPLYVTWFFGNGTLPGLWKPAKTGTGANWELSTQLKPLAEHKSYLTVVSGLEGKLVVGGSEHPTGSAGCTTGSPLNGNAVRSESIDHAVAKVLGTPPGGFKSLELGVTPATPNGAPDSLHTVSHSGPSARNMPEFDPKAVARFGARDVQRLLKDAGIVRHRGKIESTINNARRALELIDERGSLAAYFWSWEPQAKNRPKRLSRELIVSTTPESTALSKDLKKRGWTFVGPTTCYAFMQAMGLVNDHVHDCHVRPEIERARKAFTRP